MLRKTLILVVLWDYSEEKPLLLHAFPRSFVTALESTFGEKHQLLNNLWADDWDADLYISEDAEKHLFGSL